MIIYGYLEKFLIGPTSSLCSEFEPIILFFKAPLSEL